MEHPLITFRFCPVCGKDTFEIHNASARKCSSCGFTYYANPRGATIALILNPQHELLVARRAHDPGMGLLDMPGGFMEEQETAEQGVIREVMEETGLTVDRVEYLCSHPNLYPYSGMIVRTIDLVFVCHVTHFESMQAQDDVAALQWIPLDQLNLDEFAFQSVKESLRYFMDKTSK